MVRDSARYSQGSIPCLQAQAITLEYHEVAMHTYKLVWVNGEGVEKTTFFYTYSDLASFVSRQNENGNLRMFVWDIHA